MSALSQAFGPSPVKGWCPTAFEPMAASDGLLATLKPRVAGWTPGQARLIAALAREYGSGALLLTQRGNLQVRGLREPGLDSFTGALAEAGLLSGTAAAERRRNIVVDPSLAPQCDELARHLEAALEAESTLEALPAKFSFALVGTGASERFAEADCGIHPYDHASGARFLVVPAGGQVGGLTCDPVEASLALARTFVRLAAAQTPRPRRMRALVDAADARSVLEEAALQCVPFVPRWSAPSMGTVGALDHGQFALGVPFGRLDADQLVALVELAERHSSGRLRLTTERAFLLDGVDAAGLTSAAMAAGFIVDRADARLRVVACSGGSGCAHSDIDMLALAERLAPFWRAEGVLHLSGCSKGCAHPRPALLTCVARSPSQVLDIIPGGRADAASSLNLPLAELAPWLSNFKGDSLR